MANYSVWGGSQGLLNQPSSGFPTLPGRPAPTTPRLGAIAPQTAAQPQAPTAAQIAQARLQQVRASGQTNYGISTNGGPAMGIEDYYKGIMGGSVPAPAGWGAAPAQTPTPAPTTPTYQPPAVTQPPAMGQGGGQAEKIWAAMQGMGDHNNAAAFWNAMAAGGH